VVVAEPLDKVGSTAGFFLQSLPLVGVQSRDALINSGKCGCKKRSTRTREIMLTIVALPATSRRKAIWTASALSRSRA
jgi:hypothetical protein